MEWLYSASDTDTMSILMMETVGVCDQCNFLWACPFSIIFYCLYGLFLTMADTVTVLEMETHSTSTLLEKHLTVDLTMS